MGRLVLQAAQEVSDDSRVSSLRRLSLGLHVAKTTLVKAEQAEGERQKVLHLRAALQTMNWPTHARCAPQPRSRKRKRPLPLEPAEPPEPRALRALRRRHPPRPRAAAAPEAPEARGQARGRVRGRHRAAARFGGRGTAPRDPRCAVKARVGRGVRYIIMHKITDNCTTTHLQFNQDNNYSTFMAARTCFLRWRATRALILFCSRRRARLSAC